MAKFFPNLDYGFKSFFHEGNAEERIKILKKHGYKLKKAIRYLVNWKQKKVFKLEALARIDDHNFIKKVRMENNTENWVVFAAMGDLFINEEDIKYMLGHK
ncbi:MAG: hypothetical protein ACMUIM_03390 [bacterium]